MFGRLKHYQIRRFKNIRCIWFWRGNCRLDMDTTLKIYSSGSEIFGQFNNNSAHLIATIFVHHLQQLFCFILIDYYQNSVSFTILNSCTKHKLLCNVLQWNIYIVVHYLLSCTFSLCYQKDISKFYNGNITKQKILVCCIVDGKKVLMENRKQLFKWKLSRE